MEWSKVFVCCLFLLGTVVMSCSWALSQVPEGPGENVLTLNRPSTDWRKFQFSDPYADPGYGGPRAAHPGEPAFFGCSGACDQSAADNVCRRYGHSGASSFTVSSAGSNLVVINGAIARPGASAQIFSQIICR
jgi:hypothetical protein